MLEELFHFAREGLSTWHEARVPHRASLIFDEGFCEQYARATHLSDFRVIQAFVLERALAAIPQQGEALDVACGPGLLLGEFARRRPGVAFTGIDLSPAMLDQARRHIEHERIDNVRLLEVDMAHLPEHFAQRSFDAITWTFGLHYCPTAEQALATLNGMADLLRPGGAFFLVDLARFKREDTWRWFSNKYDRAHGDQFFQEIRDSYLASFSRDELADLLRQSRFSGITQEWSYLFPVLLLAHNRRADRTMPTLTSEPIHLPWRQRLKHATLRRLYALSALRSPI
ncbi:MAG: methyltransferase domain-containing protein [Candidatus Accumulibacter sp.]|jgi:ubiquinone/menaquinone biosynthesis C-methylase UbiE|uniref:class I SAM-dependent methyltransferase n=1 Tax=Accumulibacter sp. TaxID=2053492 RepID=UPI001A58E5D5|nr:class I SAM-dependent methyltransferase [Accumulibacter sp.]MBL8394251.1 methyltransferase domain-containing protein [Accumulibacter sp.]